MRTIKDSVLVAAGLAPVLAGLFLIISPLISYLGWAIGELLANPSVPRNYDGPSTVFDFIGLHGVHVVIGIVLSFIGFPMFNGALKHVKQEADEHDFLAKQLVTLDSSGQLDAVLVGRLSIRELVYKINKLLVASARQDASDKLICYKCLHPISSAQNEKFMGSCASCYYNRKGIRAYARAAGLFFLSGALIFLAIVSWSAILAWLSLGSATLATGFLAWGRYLRGEKARI